MAAGCAAGLAVGVVVLPAAAVRAVDTCPDAQFTLQNFNASRAWSQAGTKGLGVTVGVVGDQAHVTDAICAARAMAPEATVVPGITGAIVVVADPSVDPASIGGAALVIAAAGDTGGLMSTRPQGVVNVAAVDQSGAVLSSSAHGPTMTLAAYGNGTATAAGYVAGLAALLRAQHQNDKWPARQVVAQMAGSINPITPPQPDDSVGFGIIQPVQAVSLDPVDPTKLSGFDVRFPANPAPRGAAPSSPAQSAPSSAGATPAPSPSDSPAPPATATPSSAPVVVDTTDTAQQWPTGNPLTTAGGPSGRANTSAGKNDSGGGVNPVVVLGLLLLLGGGGYMGWQRWRKPEPEPVKAESEWEAPSGPRHSGYSPPEE